MDVRDDVAHHQIDYDEVGHGDDEEHHLRSHDAMGHEAYHLCVYPNLEGNDRNAVHHDTERCCTLDLVGMELCRSLSHFGSCRKEACHVADQKDVHTVHMGKVLKDGPENKAGDAVVEHCNHRCNEEQSLDVASTSDEVQRKDDLGKGTEDTH